MKNKRTALTVFLLSLVLVLGMVMSASAAEVTPYYSYTDDVAASLRISGGQATCGGSVSAMNPSNKCSVTATLKRQEGSSWVTVSGATWSGSGTGSAFASGTKSVSSGYSYRVFVTGKVMTPSGTLLETVTVQSKIVAY
ncbi:hypothetical protein SDC9_182524 [bioreactor metagenome]|uniref:Uncharacterized protein n=1 Tax=bioreactor metagenome TaxID=1076179 RepID=A0A645H8K7_9ZZZZ